MAARPEASGAAPRSRTAWKTTTIVGGPSPDGVAAPMTVDGAMTRQAFLAYVDQILVRSKPGDFVVLDNLPAYN